jgi:hypothetical protein
MEYKLNQPKYPQCPHTFATSTLSLAIPTVYEITSSSISKQTSLFRC